MGWVWGSSFGPKFSQIARKILEKTVSFSMITKSFARVRLKVNKFASPTLAKRVGIFALSFARIIVV